MKNNAYPGWRLGLLLLGAVVVWLGLNQAAEPKSGAVVPPASSSPTSEITALRQEVERLKGMVPDQSHAMKDVAYHFGNLWFAGQKTNWPLAEFYWSETRSHLHWAVRIIPVRKDAQGNDIRLSEILDPIEKGSLETLHKTILEENAERFGIAYKQMLDSCYACHLAAAKPFLRLQVPTQPEVPIVRFDPAP